MPTTNLIKRSFGWLGVDAGLVLISLAAAYYLRFGDGWPASRPSLVSVLVSALVYIISFHVANLNAENLRGRWKLLAFKTACAVLAGTAAIACVDYADPRLRLGRGILALLALNLSVGEVASRVGCSMLTPDLSERRLLIVGNLKDCLQILRRLRALRPNISVEGLLTDQFPRTATEAPVLGGVMDFAEVARGRGITDVVVASVAAGPQFWRELVDARLSGTRVWCVPDFFEALAGQIPAESLTDGWLVFGRGFQSFERPMTWRIKRLADIACSLIVLVLAAPLIILISLAIKLTSPGPVLFRQVRIGMGDRPFEILKFRSMAAPHHHEGARWTDDHDQRITAVGRCLRRLHLDELPQVINVLRGQMSFVGPRPEQPEFVEMLRARIPYYSLRHYVPPGITGWAQVNFAYANSIKSSREKFCYDLYYVRNLSLGLDLLILFRTVRVLLFGQSILRRPADNWDTPGELSDMPRHLPQTDVFRPDFEKQMTEA
jgi:exopolysaccharide biosynthesis polyprenyl glycosylphosphotransferase